MQTEILLGSDLSDAMIDRMNAKRIHEYGENTKNFKENEQNSQFFFLRGATQLVAFGMLKPLTITYLDRQYPVMGIGNIIAIEKGRGYGKRLMNDIKLYLEREATVGLGFCDQENSVFYRKCGYDVAEAITNRFRYGHVQNDPSLDVLCSEPDFLDMLKTSDELIYVDVPFW